MDWSICPIILCIGPLNASPQDSQQIPNSAEKQIKQMQRAEINFSFMIMKSPSEVYQVMALLIITLFIKSK